MENITKTFNSTKYNCIAFNRTTKETESISVILNKSFDDDTALKIITKKNDNSALVFMDIIDTESVAEKRTMSTETFMQYATALDKANPAFITRTIKCVWYSVVIYDKHDKVTKADRFMLDKEYDDDTALKLLQKRYNGVTLMVVDVLGKEVFETLWGITPEDFIKHSKVVDDSKEG